MTIELVKRAPVAHYLGSWLGLPYIGDDLGVVISMVLGIFQIVLTPFLQWILLRRLIDRAWLWIPVSIVGKWFGQVVGYTTILPYRGEDYRGSLISAEWLPIGGWSHEYFVQIYLSVGFVVGVGQYLLLRRSVRGASFWIPASTAGYLLGGILAALLFQSIYSGSETYWSGICLALGAEAIVAFAWTGVTAVPLVCWFGDRIRW